MKSVAYIQQVGPILCAKCNVSFDTQAAFDAPEHTCWPKSIISFSTVPTLPNQGWECPRCKRIWGPAAVSCWNCNVLIDTYGTPK